MHDSNDGPIIAASSFHGSIEDPKSNTKAKKDGRSRTALSLKIAFGRCSAPRTVNQKAGSGFMRSVAQL